MKKTEMLKKNYEFKYILKRGKYFSGKYIEIFILKNNLNLNLLGIAISRKLTNAVNRNKIKRIIRENYRLFEENINTGNSIIVLWKKKVDIQNATFYNIKDDMNNIFKKANIIL